MPRSSTHDTLLDHLRTRFPQRTIDVLPGVAGPVEERVPGFRVLRVHPALPGGWWLYVTSGCRAAASEGAGHGTEFVLVAPDDDRCHEESVTMTAHYHCGPPHQRLDIGHTVPIGRPWLGTSDCDHLLVSLPYPFGPEFEICRSDGAGHARILWLLPITEAEKDFRHARGLEALERRFDEQAIDPVDPGRPSVV
ncbi:suppressor of fused domain protein [Kitasatospora sp. NPDC056327]|uniref:suppressor of fused domain protein n=1 Tax=Kitasatospora sp. NPDC056327 TaxID=3345785 RepID=UPI0035E2C48F